MRNLARAAMQCVAIAVVLICMAVIYIFRLDTSDDEEWY